MQDTPLVDAQYLLDHRADPHLKIFDIRATWGDDPRSLHQDYLQGHIPGAAFLDWTQELITTGTPIPEAPVPSLEKAQASFAALGIDTDDTVVLYDDYSHMFASRLWWVMRYFGLAKVRILNGGWSHWRGQGLPVSTEEEKTASGAFVPRQQQDLLVDAKAVLERPEETGLLDGRTADSHRENRIPGAVSMPYKTLIDEDSGLFKDQWRP
ncbi:MAG: sulfurtransferase [Candidatus Latescibacteria bacterium]|nr:sulfurtransferase [Candidatus Latescibacterota bacterium]